MKTEQFVFGFRNNGVDHKGWYELHKNDVGRYRAVWFLDVIVNDQQMERNKNGIIGMEYELVGDLLNVDQRCAAYDKLESITSAEFVHDTVITEAWSVEDY